MGGNRIIRQLLGLKNMRICGGTYSDKNFELRLEDCQFFPGWSSRPFIWVPSETDSKIQNQFFPRATNSFSSLPKAISIWGSRRFAID